MICSMRLVVGAEPGAMLALSMLLLALYSISKSANTEPHCCGRPATMASAVGHCEAPACTGQEASQVGEMQRQLEQLQRRRVAARRRGDGRVADSAGGIYSTPCLRSHTCATTSAAIRSDHVLPGMLASFAT